MQNHGGVHVVGGRLPNFGGNRGFHHLAIKQIIPSLLVGLKLYVMSIFPGFQEQGACSVEVWQFFGVWLRVVAGIKHAVFSGREDD